MMLLEMDQSLQAQEKVEASTWGKQMQKAEWIPSFPGFPSSAASLGLGAADWSWAGPLLAPLG